MRYLTTSLWAFGDWAGGYEFLPGLQHIGARLREKKMNLGKALQTLRGLARHMAGRASLALVSMGAILGFSGSSSADAIPYPTSGIPNPVTYAFTAASTGDITAYFAGSTASYDNQLGMLVNGVLAVNGNSTNFGLDNHTSPVGQSLDLGHVNAGDTIVFVLHNLTLGANAYSDPSMNVAYDTDGTKGHNHVYSTPYTGTGPVIDSIPPGTFVSFEDLRFPSSDFNYNDEDFVFTNVATINLVPVPASFWAGLALFAAMGGAAWVRRTWATA